MVFNRIHLDHGCSMADLITRNVLLEPLDYEIVAGTALKRGLGGKGFSAAFRQIAREWFESLSEGERIRITELGREALKQSKRE